MRPAGSNQNQTEVVPARNGGTEVFTRNGWRKTGHCRRCDNGLFHTRRRRGAGGEKPTGTLLARPGNHLYEDEIAPGEKSGLRRRVRHREKAAIRRLAVEES
jgi:hypothetical protein